MQAISFYCARLVQGVGKGGGKGKVKYFAHLGRCYSRWIAKKNHSTPSQRIRLKARVDLSDQTAFDQHTLSTTEVRFKSLCRPLLGGLMGGGCLKVGRATG